MKSYLRMDKCSVVLRHIFECSLGYHWVYMHYQHEYPEHYLNKVRRMFKPPASYLSHRPVHTGTLQNQKAFYTSTLSFLVELRRW